MANIPQELPNQEPKSFLGYSKAIEQPKPDVSMETLFKGIGNAITGIATAGDTFIKDQIQSGLQDSIDPKRQDYIDTWNQAKQDLRGNLKTSEVNPMNAMAQANEEDMPEDVENVGDQVTSLQSARSAGKISPTAYWLALDNIAKDYRSRYPGYRPYIDQQISSITGHNPANAAFASLMSDVNAHLNAKAQKDPMVAEATKAVSGLIREGGIDTSQDKEAGSKLMRLAQQDPDKAINYVTNMRTPEWQFKMSGWNLGTRTNDLQNDAITAKRAADNYANSKIYADVNGPLIFGGETFQSIQKKMADAALDPSKADPKKMEELAYKLVFLRQMSETNMRNFLNTTTNKSGMTLAQTMSGGGDAGKTVNDFVKERYTVFDQMVNDITSKRPELAAYQSRWMQAQATNNEWNALKTDYGAHIQMMQLIGKYPDDMRNYMKTILDKNYKDGATPTLFVSEMMGQFMTGRSGGNITSVDQAVKKAREAGIEDPQVYSDFATFGTKIMDKTLKEETRVNIAASMFHPKNLRFFDNFHEDQIVQSADGTTRNMPGKYSLWQTYTSPAMVASVKELSKNNPEVAKWYKTWTEQSFGSDIFGQQIRDLNTTAADPRVKIKVDSGNATTPPRIIAETPSGDFSDRYGAAMQRRAGQLGTLDDQIFKVNQAIAGLSNAAEVQNITDPASKYGYVFGQLKGLGFIPPEPKVRPDPKVLGEQITNALISAAKAFNPLAGKPQGSVKNSTPVPTPTPPQNNAPAGSVEPQRGSLLDPVRSLVTGGKLGNNIPHYTEPQTSGSVMDFVRNPAGGVPTPQPQAPTGRVMPPHQNLTDAANTITGISITDLPKGR